ncbi:hypothetical protein D3C75_789540 [compost metagenome]
MLRFGDIIRYRKTVALYARRVTPGHQAAQTEQDEGAVYDAPCSYYPPDERTERTKGIGVNTPKAGYQGSYR